MGKSKRRVVSYLMYIGALLIFGTNGLVSSKISFDGNQIVLLRTLIGGIFLTALVLLRGGFEKECLENDKLPIIFGGISLGLSWAMLFSGYIFLNVSLATLIYSAGPILVLLLSPFILNEKLTKRKILSIVIVGLGLLCISGSILGGSVGPKGLGIAILSAIFYAGLIISNKKIERTSGFQTAAVEMDIAFLAVLVYVLLTTGLPELSKSDLAYIAIIGLVNTGLAFLLYFAGLKKLSAQSIALLSYIEPVSALIFSAVFLSESMSIIQIIGSILIIGGAIFGEIND